MNPDLNKSVNAYWMDCPNIPHSLFLSHFSMIRFDCYVFEGTSIQDRELHIPNRMIGLYKVFREWCDSALLRFRD